MSATDETRIKHGFAGSQALPGNPLRRGSASRTTWALGTSGTRGRASSAIALPVVSFQYLSPPLGLSQRSGDFALRGSRCSLGPPPPGLSRWSDDSSLRGDLRRFPLAYLSRQDDPGGQEQPRKHVRAPVGRSAKSALHRGEPGGGGSAPFPTRIDCYANESGIKPPVPGIDILRRCGSGNGVSFTCRTSRQGSRRKTYCAPRTLYSPRLLMTPTRSASEGVNSIPRWRFGLVWKVPISTAGSIACKTYVAPPGLFACFVTPVACATG